MAKNKTVLLFSGFYIPHLGGVERYTEGFAKELAKDHKVIIITSNVPQAKNHEKHGNIEIYRLPVHKMLNNRFPIPKKNKIYKELLNKIRNIKADNIVVNTRYYYTSFMGLKIAKEQGIQPVIIDHSSDYILKPYEKATLGKVKRYNPAFYGVSKRTTEWLKQLNIDAKGVFYNSVPKLSFQKKYNEDTIKIVYAARLIKEKGVELAVNSFNELKDKYPIELTIIGDGPMLAELKANNPDIKFTGNIAHDKVIDAFKKSDIFVFPTLYPEGFPTVVLEAAQAGCLVIATDRGGIRELIDDSNGYILEDDASDLTDKLSYVLKHRDIIKDKGKRARDDISKKYTWEINGKIIRKELSKYEKS